ncbi:MAG TPA: histidine phosphatase family protein [Anaerolineales bacterium]|jgi:broad specificity phosphatase PhoE
MTKLCLVRHGQTDWNIQGRWQGHADPPLNAVGLEQAGQLSASLAHEHFSAIYSSDLQRARFTAEAVARFHGLPVHADPRLRELNMGAWEGKLVTEIPVLFPASWEERQRDPLGSRPPGGESVQELAARIIPAISGICAEHAATDQLLIVSHGLALATFLCHVESRPLVEAYLRIPHNATPVYVEWSPQEINQ